MISAMTAATVSIVIRRGLLARQRAPMLRDGAGVRQSAAA
jgi:hypothetical protein